jgi:predicted nucleic acid-binding protein
VATLRVVLDTNVLLSGIAYPASVPGQILAAWRHGSLEVVLSVYILDELSRVLPKSAHRQGLSASEIENDRHPRLPR